ncbi:MAG TPA: hypothetical protein PKI93_04705 [Alphaproteobacteria bacterium]|nr:hypothetical protein [Alphaproteobacteria bacterium]HNS44000.1 hypothetical protein [Alphaproteobacteria bacterium]
MKSITIEETTRAQVAEFLPRAISKALQSYHEFMEGTAFGEEAKEFSDAHKAAKVAISHIELLIKLAKWADLPDAAIESKGELDEFSNLMNRAEGDVKDYYAHRVEGDDE